MGGDRRQERIWEYLRETGRPSLLRNDTPEVQWALRKLRSYQARGMSLSAMADQVGLAQDAVTRLLRDERPALRRSTFEKIRKIQFDDVTPLRGRVSHLGTQRRLRALRADGFPYTLLCAELGHARNSPRIQRILTGTRHGGGEVGFVIASTARQVEALYDKLDGVRPEDVGVTPHGVKYSQRRAAELGYAPRSCWIPDTIDDPESFPEWTGACGTARGRRIHKLEGIPMCDRCSGAPDDRALLFSPEKFKRLRERAGWSQRALEKEAGVASGCVTHWERGGRWSYASSGRRMPVIEKVMAVLDCTFEDIAEREGS